LRISSVVWLNIETAPTPQIDPAEWMRMEQLSGAEVGTQVTIWGRELHKFRPRCRRTATASLFLGRSRTSDSTRIQVWISLLKPGSAD
jgi:hypothetical protein